MNNNVNILSEIKKFLDGYNNELKYLVNVETSPDTNYADCFIHEPGKEPEKIQVRYTPFMYMRDLSLFNMKLYATNEEIIENKMIQYGIQIEDLKTGNHKRLKNGFSKKITSTKSYNAIINFLRDGGINPFERKKDAYGKDIKDKNGKFTFIYGNLFYSPRTTEQFFISTQSRLYKGYEEYKQVHKVTFDIETTGLNYQISRVFAIGVKDNRGNEIVLEAAKMDDDDAEIKLIQDFFNLIVYLRAAIITGFNSEEFDFGFILGRAKLLNIDLSKMQTTLNDKISLKRKPNTPVKYGNTSDSYTSTELWGMSVIDILHAAKRTAAINTDLKETKLKYLAKFEKIAKPNRTYIQGEDGDISNFYIQNKIFVIDEFNNYTVVPDEFQITAKNLYLLQINKNKFTDDEYKLKRNGYLNSDKSFVNWFKEVAISEKKTKLITGKKLVKQYLLDDLWETEKIDELYNQSSFMLAKIVPTTYQRICTMGTAAIWNLLLTAWSYENGLAIPHTDNNENFSGGLARCFKTGLTEKIVKIDYASLYPMLQLTWDIFPMFDITGVIRKMLLYLTTTRNIYKKLANGDELNNNELSLLNEIDHDVAIKYKNNEITENDRALFKIKQLPIKILNNSLFGALGSGISFNWSDNICAARITCSGRLELRHAIWWFKKFECVPLLAVTDGINFKVPIYTKIKVNGEGVTEGITEGVIEEMWQYNGKTGIHALVEKYNTEEMKGGYMAVDLDGEYLSCLNLSRINYATLALSKDKKSGQMKEKVKLTGNTIKSKVMPEYIEEFIDKGLDLILHNKGKEFVDYYNSYAEMIYQKRIPLKKIATKNKVKATLSQYKKRGKDKNGRDKGMQAHMELLIQERNRIAEKIFQEHKNELDLKKSEEKLSIEEKSKLIINYMPPEPPLDSVIYHVNTGYLKSHGSSSKIIDKVTNEERLASSLINAKDLIENPNMTGDYNVVKYLDAFNKRVSTILVGFEPEIAEKILCKISKKKEKVFDKMVVVETLQKGTFLSKDLVLGNFDDDTFEEAIFLEKKEVDFWNKTGYDPRLVWSGFKMHSDNTIYYEIYENALNYLNQLMDKANKPKIKSINDKYEKNDYVLIKNDSEYNLGYYNGVYMEIIREHIEVPKSKIELELEKIEEENKKKIENLKVILNEETESEKKLAEENEKLNKYFKMFKETFNLNPEMRIEDEFFKMEDVQKMFKQYVKNIELENEKNDPEFFDFESNE